MIYCCFTHIMDLTWCGDYVNGDITGPVLFSGDVVEVSKLTTSCLSNPEVLMVSGPNLLGQKVAQQEPRLLVTKIVFFFKSPILLGNCS